MMRSEAVIPAIPSLQVIPPRGRARFPLVFTATEVRDVHEKVEYSINGNHVMSLDISGEVQPVSLDLSAEDLHFEFAVDNWESYIEKVSREPRPPECRVDVERGEVNEDDLSLFLNFSPLQALILDNPNKFPVEYTIESAGGTFSCSPNSGAVKPLSSGEVLVKWTPPLDGSACGTVQKGSLTLTLVGGMRLHHFIPDVHVFSWV